MTSRPLLERTVEQSRVEQALDAALVGDGRVVALVGPAGIGKTSLLRAAVDSARARDMAVLRAVGGDLEQEFPFAVIRQLATPALAGAVGPGAGLLAGGPAALAAPLLHGPAGGGAEPVRAAEPVLHGLHWFFAGFAAHQPLLLAIDDVHWADPASMRFLHYLARRLDGLPILVVLAGRDSEPEPLPPLRALLAERRTLVVRPSPLSPAAVRRLVRGRLSPRAGDALCTACHVATGGNPFLLGELLHVLVQRKAAGAQVDAEAVAGIAPDAVSTAVSVRLARLPAAAAPLARAVAVLGPDAEFRHAVRLAEVDEGAASEAVAALARAGILEDVRPLRFVHPVVREAMYDELAPARRSQQHRRAADLLLAEGADPERVAPHLRLVEERGDADVVRVLRAAAQQALARAAPEAAVSLLERALREPPDLATRPAVLTELGLAEALVHHPRTLDHLAEALSLTVESPSRARVAALLANVLTMRGEVPAAVQVLDDALNDETPPELALALENGLIQVARLHPQTSAVARRRTDRLRARGVVPVRGPLTTGQRLTLANVAVEMARAGEAADQAADAAERALDRGRLLLQAPAEEPPFGSAVMVLVYADRYDAAARELCLGIAQARRRGSAVAFAVTSLMSAMLAYRRGALADAQRHLSAVEASEALPPFFEPFVVKTRIDVLLEADDPAGAEQLLAERGAAGEVPPAYSWNCLLEARGRLRLAQGDPRAAVADLRLTGCRQDALDERNPAVLAWRSGAALAHAALEERLVAVELVGDAVARARVFGAPRAIGVALRAGGLVVGGRDGIDMLGEAVAALDGSGADLELARALTDLGAALRRGGSRSQARERLRRGLDLAVRCGSHALAHRAHTELIASGARPRRLVLSGAEALTASQRRIAEMAAAGWSNPQIAQALFVSSRTVEMHLTATYRKLGITAREELAAALDVPVGADDAGR